MKEYSIVAHEKGFDIEAGDIRIKNIDDILFKQSPTDVGESLKEYIASKIEGVDTIHTSNLAKAIEENKDSIEKVETEV